MDMKWSFDRQKPFNQLPNLPPPDDIIDKEILVTWGLASRNLAALNKNLQSLPDPLLLIHTVSLREAKSSSEIENIFTSDDELYKAISDSVREENASGETKEVLRYREALWAGYNDIKQTGVITRDTLVKIFQQIKNTSQTIRSPHSRVVIRRGDSSFQTSEVIYTPPRGEGVVQAYLDNLIEYLNEENARNLDPLIRMAISHYQFEAIHPFSDGNGRTGRILCLLYLITKDLLSLPVLYLSKYIIENKQDYYFGLAGVSQRGDWKGWILYILKAVQYTSAYTNRLIDDIMEQTLSTLEFGKASLKWYSKDVNEMLFRQPYFKPSLINQALGRKSRTTLTKYMDELIGLGIISPLREGKEVYYLNNDLVRILED